MNEIAKGLDFVICPSDSGVAIDCYILKLNFLVFLNKVFQIHRIKKILMSKFCL